MKHKERCLKYAHRYQTMSAEEWRKVVFSDVKKFNLDGPDGFQKYWQAKHFPEENHLTSHWEGGSLMISGAFSSSGKLKLHWQTKSNS